MPEESPPDLDLPALQRYLEGIHARYLAAETVGTGYEGLDAAVPALIELGHRVLDDGLAAMSS